MNTLKIIKPAKGLGTALLVGFLIQLSVSCTKEKNESMMTDEVANAPGFTLKSLDGADVSLSDYSNKVVLLFFLGYNCPYCKAAVPNIQSNLIAPYVSRNDYVFLGLDQWNGNSAGVESFKTSTGATFTLLLNASAVATLYNTTYDRFVLIDKAGNIIFKGSQTAANDIGTVKAKIDLEFNK